MSDIENMLRVGVISSTHGIKGEVKVYPTTDDPKRFEQLKKVFLDYKYKGIRENSKEKIIALEISGVRYFKQFVILKFKGINDINDVEKYKGMDLYVAREDAIPLEEGEYYIADLIGLTIIDDKDEVIGELVDVMQTGANDVYLVKTVEKFGAKEIMIPGIKDCIKEINIEDKKIKVHLMEGLMDL